MKFKFNAFFFIFFMVVVFVFSSHSQQSGNEEKNYSIDLTQASLQEKVGSLFTQSCSTSGCHTGKYPPMNLNLEKEKFLKSLLNIPSQEIPSLKLVNKENPEKSYLLMKIRGDKSIIGSRMPAGSPPLKEEEIKTIEDWISSLNKNLVEQEKAQIGLKTDAVAKTVYEQEKKQARKPTFWGTRIINLPTAQTPEKGRLLFRISHRYNPTVRSGYDSFFGLDGPAVVLLSLGYGLKDNLSVTLARSKLDKEVELSLKWTMFRQGEKFSLPLSMALYLGGSLVTQSQPDKKVFHTDNMKLNLQVILSHQMSNTLSFLLVPAYSSNTNHWDPSSEGTFSLGAGGRWMIYNDFSIIGEWIPVLAGYKDNSNGWGLGLEKKIGGHVFQLFILNSDGLTSDQFIPGGDLRLKDKDFRFGFNIFRIF